MQGPRRRATIWGGARPGRESDRERNGATMFNTIVVGVDGREGGRDALALAERLKSVFGGEVIAVHAYQYDSFHSRAIGPDYQRTLHENATALVQ
jgi:nucleotide-binding universal stress UspA family protein